MPKDFDWHDPFTIKKYFSLLSLMLIIYFGISIKLYVIPIKKLDFREKTEFMISFE